MVEDFGIVIGVGICSNISRANGVGIGIGTAIVFDLYVPKQSALRDDAINSPNAITRSGLTTGFFFTVSGSNLGAGVTSLDRSWSFMLELELLL